MPRKKLEKRNVRKIFKSSGGSSYAVTLPIEGVRGFKWKEGQKLTIEIDKKNKRMIIRDWKK